jgi:predicted RNA binding protein YcfA (HicA-like mRNA interferase family)
MLVEVYSSRQGDHDVWYNPKNGQKVTVPVKLMSRHTANGILKDAGLPKI